MRRHKQADDVPDNPIAPPESPPAEPLVFPEATHIREHKTDGLAVLAILFAFLFPPLGFILGFVALARTGRRSRVRGRGLAKAAIVISLIFGAAAAYILTGYAFANPFI